MKKFVKYLTTAAITLTTGFGFSQSSSYLKNDTVNFTASNKNIMHTVSANSADVELKLDLSK